MFWWCRSRCMNAASITALITSCGAAHTSHGQLRQGFGFPNADFVGDALVGGELDALDHDVDAGAAH